jgi:hypothetical protein
MMKESYGTGNYKAEVPGYVPLHLQQIKASRTLERGFLQSCIWAI